MAQSEQTRRQTDVVVVGPGVAGALVAYELARVDKSMLMLEAGPCLSCQGIVRRFRNQADKTGFVVPYLSMPWAPHPEYGPPNNYLMSKGEHQFNLQHIRVMGGTTWHWVALTWRLLPNDLKLCSVCGIARDQPVQYQDLEHYYGLAEEALGVWGPNGEDLGSSRSQSHPMTSSPLSFSERMIKDALNTHDASFHVVVEPAACNSRPHDGYPTCCGNNNCMSICPIGAMHNGIAHVEKTEQAGAWLIEDTVVFELEVDPDERIVAVRYKDSKGAEHHVEGKWFVLATNGIETPKLVLMSTSQDSPKGVGNSSDTVGHNLMDHPGIDVGSHADCKLWSGRGPQEITSLIGFRDGPFRATQVGKKLHLPNISRIEQGMQRIFKEGKLIRPVDLDARIRDQVVRYVQFDSFHEILPSPENRIVPSTTEMDAIGIPRPKITYHIDDYVKRSVVHTREVYAMATQVMGGTNVEFHDDLALNNHITDTTITGVDSKDPVVDKDCRTFDHPNLFISSSSAMPTVGIANVTLTTVVLAPRIAGQPKEEA